MSNVINLFGDTQTSDDANELDQIFVNWVNEELQKIENTSGAIDTKFRTFLRKEKDTSHADAIVLNCLAANKKTDQSHFDVAAFEALNNHSDDLYEVYDYQLRQLEAFQHSLKLFQVQNIGSKNAIQKVNDRVNLVNEILDLIEEN